MEELLKQWADREPDRCDIDEQGRAWIETEYSNFTVYVDEVLEKDQMLILGATMQAIERRGWDWMLYSSNQGKSWDAKISEGKISEEKTHAWANSEEYPAEALLSAYIKALAEVS